MKVYNPAEKQDFANGWACYFPPRGIQPGNGILSWNRLVNRSRDVEMNYGDSTEWYPIEMESIHSYRKSGRYVVTPKSVGRKVEPVTLKMEVVVD